MQEEREREKNKRMASPAPKKSGHPIHPTKSPEKTQHALRELFESILKQVGHLKAFSDDLKRITTTEIQAASTRLRRLLDHLEESAIDLRSLIDVGLSLSLIQQSDRVISPTNPNSKAIHSFTLPLLGEETLASAQAVDHQTVALHIAHETLLAVKKWCHADVAYLFLPDNDTTNIANAEYISLPPFEAPHPALFAVARAVDTQRTAVNITDKTSGAIFHSILAMPLRLPSKSMRRYGVALIANRSERGASLFTDLEEGKMALAAECLSQVLGPQFGAVSLKAKCPKIADGTFAERWMNSAAHRFIAEETTIFRSVKGVSVWLRRTQNVEDALESTLSLTKHELVKQTTMMEDLAAELTVARNAQETARARLRLLQEEVSTSKEATVVAQKKLMEAQHRLYHYEKEAILQHRKEFEKQYTPSSPTVPSGTSAGVRVRSSAGRGGFHKVDPYLPKTAEDPSRGFLQPNPPWSAPNVSAKAKKNYARPTVVSSQGRGAPRDDGNQGGAMPCWNTSSVATRKYEHKLYLM